MKQDLRKLKLEIEQLPTTFGVYQFTDEEGTILYIGKAINLRSRVRSYFQSDHLDRPWVAQMIPLIHDVEVIQTENDVESLILESNLIMKHKPKYNSAGKDDKRYAWILINTRAVFPIVEKSRDLGRKGRHFGPYPDGRAVNHILKYVRKIYPYRDCKLQMYPNRKSVEVKKSRLCVYYHLGLCSGPCDNLISSKDYKVDIQNIVKTLTGKKKSHVRELRHRMDHYAHRQQFEKAATIRDKIQDLLYLSQQIDIQFGDAEDEFKEIQEARFVAGISEMISLLGLNIPEHKIKNTRIECYDISNISGEITYGSMVVSEGTKIRNSEYRIFKVREKKKSNDPEMIKRVLERRLKYLSNDNPDQTQESLLKRPHIILLDGAQPQLSAIKEIIPDNIGLVAISKGKHLKRAGDKQIDEFWTISRDKSEKPEFKKIRLANPFLFQRLRDEAHRFAIKHHRQGRRYNQKKSILDEIPGIGPKRKKALMTKFKTIEKIAAATDDELIEVLKSKPEAKAVSDYLAKQKRISSSRKGSQARS